MQTVPTDAAVGVEHLDHELLPSIPHAFPKADDCRLAAHAFIYNGHDDDPTAPARLPDAFLDGQASIGVTPGGLILHRRLRPTGRELSDAPDALGQQQFPHVDEDQAADDDLGPWHGPIERDPVTPTRWWSDRSRSRMIRTLASVDWTPVFFIPRTRPAMVTLTYPGDWLTVAPDADTSKAHLIRMHKRIDRLYKSLGLPPAPGVWKLEFQARGAPHFHIYMAVPVERLGGGELFREWLSRTWADVVDHPDLEQRARHARAGTGVDFAEGARCSDPKRLAVYFTRHNAKGGRSKAYQHRVPDAWTTAGRWWGTWRVERVEVEAPITDHELVEAKRLLRRWVRSQSRVAPRRVKRGVSPSGVVRYRWVTRRYEVRSLAMSQGGFVICNDGPKLAAMLARYLDDQRSQS